MWDRVKQGRKGGTWRGRDTEREREESGVKRSNFSCQIMGTLRGHCNNLDCYSAIKNRGLLEDFEEWRDSIFIFKGHFGCCDQKRVLNEVERKQRDGETVLP